MLYGNHYIAHRLYDKQWEKNNNANVQGQKTAYKNLTVKLNNKLKPEEELKQKVRAKARP